MQIIPLKAEARKKEQAAGTLRRSGKVPCVLYGNKVKNTTLQCDHSELYRVYAKAGESVLVEIALGEQKIPALFHAVDFAPVRDDIIHADFYAVDMKKEIEANVPIVLTGVAPAVRDIGAVLVHVLDHLTVTCLPANLPQHLEASVENLKEFDDALHVSDVHIPAGVTVAEALTAVIATVQEPRREIVEEVVPAEGEVPAVTPEGTAIAGDAAPAADAAAGKDKKEKKEKKE